MTGHGQWHDDGIGLVELLVVLAILGLLLGMLIAYFGQETKATALSQAQNTLQVKLRSVGEVVMQDLELAGARSIVVSSGAVLRPALDTTGSGTITDSACTSSDASGCLQWDSEYLTIYYLSRLTSEPCHKVVYRFSANELDRGDTEAAVNPQVLCDVSATPTYSELASGITAFDLTFVCGDSSLSPSASQEKDPSYCHSKGSYVAEADITISGEVNYRGRVLDASFSAKAPTPNLRSSQP